MSKPEIRMKPEARMTKRRFGLRHSDFIRISGFERRVCALLLRQLHPRLFHDHVVVAQQRALGELELGDGVVVVADGRGAAPAGFRETLLLVQLAVDELRRERLVRRLALTQRVQRVLIGEHGLPGRDHFFPRRLDLAQRTLDLERHLVDQRCVLRDRLLLLEPAAAKARAGGAVADGDLELEPDRVAEVAELRLVLKRAAQAAVHQLVADAHRADRGRQVQLRQQVLLRDACRDVRRIDAELLLPQLQPILQSRRDLIFESELHRLHERVVRREQQRGAGHRDLRIVHAALQLVRQVAHAGAGANQAGAANLDRRVGLRNLHARHVLEPAVVQQLRGGERVVEQLFLDVQVVHRLDLRPIDLLDLADGRLELAAEVEEADALVVPRDVDAGAARLDAGAAQQRRRDLEGELVLPIIILSWIGGERVVGWAQRVVVLDLIPELQFGTAGQHLANAAAEREDLRLAARGDRIAENAARAAVWVFAVLELGRREERRVEPRLGFDDARLLDRGAIPFDPDFQVVRNGALDDFAERDANGRLDADRRARRGHGRGLRGGRTGRGNEGTLQRRRKRLLVARRDFAGGADLVLLEFTRVERRAVLDAPGDDQGEQWGRAAQ